MEHRMDCRYIYHSLSIRRREAKRQPVVAQYWYEYLVLIMRTIMMVVRGMNLPTESPSVADRRSALYSISFRVRGSAIEISASINKTYAVQEIPANGP
jgi:hypothetical protein